MIDPTFWAGLGTGLVVSAVGGLLLRWFLGRRPSSTEHTGDVGERPTTRALDEGNELDPHGRSEAVPRDLILPDFPPTVSWTDRRAGALEMSSWEEGLRTSERLLLHIARQGSIGPDEVAPRALCQAGMIDALGIRQGALTGVLRRLVSAQVLAESREHVRGIDRRVKVYRLTPAGDRLIRQLWARRPTRETPELRSPASSERGSSLPRVQIVPPPERANAPRT